MHDDLLSTYLNDHLGGATGGVELAARLRNAHAGTDDEEYFVDLHRDIAEDREALIAIIRACDLTPATTRVAGGWIAEKLGAVRFSEVVTGSDALSRLLEMETMAIGIRGKLQLWHALQASGAVTGRVPEGRLAGLVERAEAQLDSLEVRRRRAAVRALQPTVAAGD